MTTSWSYCRQQTSVGSKHVSGCACVKVTALLLGAFVPGRISTSQLVCLHLKHLAKAGLSMHMNWPCLVSEHVPRPPRGLLPLSNQSHDQMLGQITSELLSLLAPMKNW